MTPALRPAFFRWIGQTLVVRSYGWAGSWLLAAGFSLLVSYGGVIWFGVFANDTADQVCGPGVPHRDNFFPPYTACGDTGQGLQVTSRLAEYAGAALFILAAAMLIGGLVLMLAGRYSRRLERPVSLSTTTQ
jgi:hypothetical protein